MYGEAKEVLPYYAPTPPGDYVRTTYCVGAKLLCDQITGRSITVVLHLVNKTQVVGTIRNRVLCIQPHMVLSFFLTVSVWRRLFI